MQENLELHQHRGRRSTALNSENDRKNNGDEELHYKGVQEAMQNRYACTRFQRFEEEQKLPDAPSLGASKGDPIVIQKAKEILDVARRAPSGFNVQPYKLLLVSSPRQKEALAQYCIGRNADRVRDSDCTVLFLADRQSLRELPRYRKEVLRHSKRNNSDNKGSNNSPSSSGWNRWKLLKIQLLVGMFSSGLPLPQWLSGPISWGFRLAMRCLSWILRRRLVLPTLSNAETWSQKNTMLVAMSYLLGCTSRGIATSPMEGYLTWGIRQALRIPRRYSIPLIVATGSPFIRTAIEANDENESPDKKGKDDAGLKHGTSPDSKTVRYDTRDTIFGDEFGKEIVQ